MNTDARSAELAPVPTWQIQNEFARVGGGDGGREGGGRGLFPEPNRSTKANCTELPISSPANNLRDRSEDCELSTEGRERSAEGRHQCGWLSYHTLQCFLGHRKEAPTAGVVVPQCQVPHGST